MNTEPDYGSDADVPEEHKQILDSRINAYESGQAKIIEWEEAILTLNGLLH
jgi:Putative addiction module component